jgi:hypothetical protein
VRLIYGPGCERFLKPFGFGAMAVGEVIFAPSREALRRHLAHEWAHVRQARRFGPVFPVLYLGSSLMCVLQGKPAYAENYFEREARDFEAERSVKRAGRLKSKA